ncbi:hypothetical protein F5984_15280 [Rudanella paleaurantiibacter]|uniref:Outer membrane beta-barrel protein n=1 Tax=Rudanella paleaurantiibacter TaxID=2614655 RepID=A0A7J5TYM9_9BACT|nr:hypothetical protein [Rudanella paleaurantiibacter]KAB7729016.1 hypothetical protein F5984_15280 [Rudanella paleaurantiibacter]
MAQFDEFNFLPPQGTGDPDLRRLFDEAAEAPPPRVWDAIERELDESDRVVVIPFWGRPATWVWSAAAVVALLLVGWWSLRQTGEQPMQAAPSVAAQSSTDRPGVTQPSVEPALTTQLAQTGKPANRPTRLSAPQGSTPAEGPAGLSAQSPRVSGAGSPAIIAQARKPQSPDLVSKPAGLNGNPADALAQNTSVASPTNTGPTTGQPPMPTRSLDGPARMAAEEQAIARVNEKTTETAPALPPVLSNPPVEQGANATAQPVAIASLDTKPFRPNTMYGTQRIVWFRPDEELSAPAELTQSRQKAEQWASVSVTPSSFNPTVGLKPALTTYGNAFAQLGNAAPADLSLKSEPNRSIAYQISAGRQLGERWTIETGVGYLEARSTVVSPTQTLVASMIGSANRSSSLYADVLQNSRPTASNDRLSNTPSKGGTSNPLQNSNVYDAQLAQSLTNNYTFVQIPVQMGFQLRPRKRFGMSLLGGFLTNLFVRNTVNDQISVTNSDGVYRPVTLSASTGLRFRYRPTGRWSASMAGIFQQALQRGTRESSDLTIRPQTMGVSVGLDYHF